MADTNLDQPSSLRQVQGMLRRLWRSGLLFLEIIGLREEHDVSHEEQLARLRLYHTEFRKLISANHSFLEILGDLEEKRLGRHYVDQSLVIRKAVAALSAANAMVQSINVISRNRYTGLQRAFDRISAALTEALDEEPAPASSELVLDLRAASGLKTDRIGGKMAALSELANSLRLPVPDGMVVTTEAFRLVLEEGGIRSWIQDKHLHIVAEDDVDHVSMELQDRLSKLPVPTELEREILDAYDRLTQRAGASIAVAVRSSAVGEDSEFSFAGQFLSLLNVPRQHLCKAYLRVVASLYSPEAMHYRFLHKIPGEFAQMAVGFIAMVDAEASGVVFSQDPNRPDSNHVLIQAVRGLGVTLVDGKTSPEMILVSRDFNRAHITRFPSSQLTRTVLAPDFGVKQEGLAEEEAAAQCISDEQALQLARWAVRLEDHFGGPQDIEWAVERDGRVILLQSRPLRISTDSFGGGEAIEGATVLVTGGETGCPGVGSGPAVILNDDSQVDGFPEGGVLVARRSSPKFIRLMSKTGAIVTDVGSTTGHMASLAREFRVPTLLNTKGATRAIAPGAIVTVDATRGFVYQGEIPELVARETADDQIKRACAWDARSQPLQLLDKVVSLVSPLNLTDPAASTFTADNCLTLHDIARFVHEKSYREMFMMADNVGDLKGGGYKLDVFLPIDLYIIDLGGGLKETPATRALRRSQIGSVPFTALLNGMLHRKIPRFGPRPMDLGGLFGIIMRHAVTNPEAESSFRDPCYAIISDKYMNLTARVGYHFNVVDAYCGQTQNKNYISVLFQGGAAEYVRRTRRARAIAEILREHGFSVDLKHDLVNARLSKGTEEETLTQLEMLGSLFQFFRQMDVAMVNDNAVALFRDAFLRGDYGLEELPKS